MAPAAARLSTAGDDRKRIAALMRDYSHKGDVGRVRTFAKLRHHFQPAIVEPLKAGILWSWLEPRSAVLADPEDPGEEQNAILVRYGVAWVVRKRELLGYTAFSLEIPDHCTGRMLQRSPGLDIRAALHQAHHALFQASRFIFARARTWIADNMVRADQTLSAAAPTGIQSQLTIMTMLALEQAED
jgi:hypothetical protein